MSDINIAVTVDAGLDVRVTAEPRFDIAVGLESVQGIGVQSLAVNEAGHLLVTLSNGVIIDAGSVNGLIAAETARAEAAERGLAVAMPGIARRCALIFGA